MRTKLKLEKKQLANPDFACDRKDKSFVSVMAYYHIDSAIRYLEELGFPVEDMFKEPLVADARGTTLANPTKEDNAYYSPGMGLLTFGLGGIPNAEDGEMILHEFGHALQDAICPDFGQSFEAAAIGEGFSDYLAASFFADRKPQDYRTLIMSWDVVTEGGNPRPFGRRVDENVTFNDFLPFVNEEHTNGQIWSATLWQIREALGSKMADTLIIESHFQLDAFTTFARGARAILDADQNLYGGHHQKILRGIFGGRQIKQIA